MPAMFLWASHKGRRIFQVNRLDWTRYLFIQPSLHILRSILIVFFVNMTWGFCLGHCFSYKVVQTVSGHAVTQRNIEAKKKIRRSPHIQELVCQGGSRSWCQECSALCLPWLLYTTVKVLFCQALCKVTPPISPSAPNVETHESQLRPTPSARTFHAGGSWLIWRFDGPPIGGAVSLFTKRLDWAGMEKIFSQGATFGPLSFWICPPNLRKFYQ